MDAYFFIAILYYLEGDNGLFRQFARRYFALQGKQPPWMTPPGPRTRSRRMNRDESTRGIRRR